MLFLFDFVKFSNSLNSFDFNDFFKTDSLTRICLLRSDNQIFNLLEKTAPSQTDKRKYSKNQLIEPFKID